MVECGKYHANLAPLKSCDEVTTLRETLNFYKFPQDNYQIGMFAHIKDHELKRADTNKMDILNS